MDALLSRFRNLTVLIVVVLAQLIYLGYQVRANRDERLIRVWAVSAVTPMAGIVEAIRQNTIGFLEDYFILLDVREQNRKLKADNDRLRLQNIYYRNQLATAEHARALTIFQAQTPSKTIAARVIGNSTVASAKAVFIDRGSTSGVEQGMAVVTPEGIVGKVVSVYPLVSQVLLVTDPTFKLGVESQKGHVRGVLSCDGLGKCKVEHIQNEEKVDKNEWFYTSGEDRIFPKGFPVGTVVSSEPGQGMREVWINLSGAPGGVDEVLVVLQGVHQAIPPAPAEETATAKMLPPPPDDGASKADVKPQTEADKVLHQYEEIGKQEDHVYGGLGSNLPNFNPKPAPKTTTAPAAPANAAAESTATAPPRATILGAPKTPASGTATSTATPAEENPVLPLGAPRRKPATGATTTQPAPPRP